MNTEVQKLETYGLKGVNRLALHTGIRTGAERRAKVLGFVSLGVGVVALFAPSAVAKLIGAPDTSKSRLVLRLMGLREAASGAGLLIHPDSAGWLWSRVAGDVMNLGLLGGSFTSVRVKRGRLAVAAGAVLGATAVDTISAARVSHGPMHKLAAPIHVVKSITIKKSPTEIYAFWRDLENLPRFMQHLESVKVTNGTSTWRAKAPAGMSIEWKAEITLDEPGESIGWRSIEGASVPNRGVVRFAPAPGGRGTQVLVELKYDAPGGALGAAIAKLFGEEPSQQISGDLRRLKQVMETGEVMQSDASIHKGLHAARPASEGERAEKLKGDIK